MKVVVPSGQAEAQPVAGGGSSARPGFGEDLDEMAAFVLPDGRLRGNAAGRPGRRMACRLAGPEEPEAATVAVPDEMNQAGNQARFVERLIIGQIAGGRVDRPGREIRPAPAEKGTRKPQGDVHQAVEGVAFRQALFPEGGGDVGRGERLVEIKSLGRAMEGRRPSKGREVHRRARGQGLDRDGRIGQEKRFQGEQVGDDERSSPLERLGDVLSVPEEDVLCPGGGAPGAEQRGDRLPHAADVDPVGGGGRGLVFDQRVDGTAGRQALDLDRRNEHAPVGEEVFPDGRGSRPGPRFLQGEGREDPAVRLADDAGADDGRVKRGGRPDRVGAGPEPDEGVPAGRVGGNRGLLLEVLAGDGDHRPGDRLSAGVEHPAPDKRLGPGFGRRRGGQEEKQAETGGGTKQDSDLRSCFRQSHRIFF
ncbi:MAG: hypothetical protein BWX98_02350 [Candidatus Aminicenantes bacterium ADurb.Bin147]|nr:MAG: hypothetical protein BWX98_02350 [Candidatus Aminicenantes bacterium ADurb.Bin147]